MSDHCGTTTEEGNAVCIPGACTCSSESKSGQPALLSVPLVNKIKETDVEAPLGDSHVEENS
jgi:hypothetical protein